jgi:DNA-binding MarR family transcriptional regulator
MLLDALYAMPGHLIRRSQQIAVSLFAEETAPFGVTPVQYAALVAIREQPDVDATRLSELIAFDRSTIGNVLERLERKGLIARKSGTRDKRTKRLRVTARGARLLVRIRKGVERAQERILAPLAPAERRQFMAMLTKLVHVNNRYSRVPLRTVAAGSAAKASSRTALTAPAACAGRSRSESRRSVD